MIVTRLTATKAQHARCKIGRGFGRLHATCIVHRASFALSVG